MVRFKDCFSVEIKSEGEPFMCTIKESTSCRILDEYSRVAPFWLEVGHIPAQ